MTAPRPRSRKPIPVPPPGPAPTSADRLVEQLLGQVEANSDDPLTAALRANSKPKEENR